MTKNLLEGLLEQVRGEFQRADLHAYFANSDRLTTAQVALDTAEDALLAISHYQRQGIGGEDGEKYLKLYGFLQAIVLQEDAIRKLCELFVGRFVEPGRHSGWKRLRELRNLTVGHPIEKGLGNQPRKRAFIVRVCLKTDGFDYQVWHQKTGNTSSEHADLLKMYGDYELLAVAFLKKILRHFSSVPAYVP